MRCLLVRNVHGVYGGKSTDRVGQIRGGQDEDVLSGLKFIQLRQNSIDYLLISFD